MATGLEKEESDKVLLAANSTPISQLGEVAIKVEVGERITTSKMIVSDQVESIQLGLDWLTTNKGKIDFETGVLTVLNVKISLHRNNQNGNCRRIIVGKDVIVPPSTETNVKSLKLCQSKTLCLNTQTTRVSWLRSTRTVPWNKSLLMWWTGRQQTN